MQERDLFPWRDKSKLMRISGFILDKRNLTKWGKNMVKFQTNRAYDCFASVHGFFYFEETETNALGLTFIQKSRGETPNSKFTFK